jgi:hypothetical protein
MINCGSLLVGSSPAASTRWLENAGGQMRILIWGGGQGEEEKSGESGGEG